VISRVRSRPPPRQFVEPFCSLTFAFLLFWPVGWVCVLRVGDHDGKKRWSSPGSRCDIYQAPGHPRILLPLCVLPNSPASGLASSHRGVARNDSHRTVSSTASFHGYLPRWRSLKPPLFPSSFLPPSLFPSPSLHNSCCGTHTNQGSNRRADPSQTWLVKGTAYSRASTRKRDLERRQGDR
jgi:hypothetical protein